MLYKTNLFKNGNATSIRIPKSLLNELHLKAGDEVSINLKDNALIIESTNPPPPDKTLVQSALSSIKPYFNGELGYFTNKSEDNYTVMNHKSLNVKCYNIPLYSKNNKTFIQTIMIPIEYVNNFKKLLSFLYDYILCESKHNNLDQVINSNRLSMLDRWFDKSHDLFFNEYDLEKSIYYHYLKESVLNETH